MSGRVILRAIFWIAMAALWVALMAGALILLVLMAAIVLLAGSNP